MSFGSNLFSIAIFSQLGSSAYLYYTAPYSSLGMDNTKFYKIKVSWDGTSNAGGVKLFIDGVQKNLTPNNLGTFIGLGNGTAPLCIGGVNWTTSFQLGAYLKNFKLYNYVW